MTQGPADRDPDLTRMVRALSENADAVRGAALLLRRARVGAAATSLGLVIVLAYGIALSLYRGDEVVSRIAAVAVLLAVAVSVSWFTRMARHAAAAVANRDVRASSNLWVNVASTAMLPAPAAMLTISTPRTATTVSSTSPTPLVACLVLAIAFAGLLVAQLFKDRIRPASALGHSFHRDGA